MPLIVAAAKRAIATVISLHFVMIIIITNLNKSKENKTVAWLVWIVGDGYGQNYTIIESHNDIESARMFFRQ